jgi:DNA-binding LacI/PurR family transcriptional regulator
MSKSPSAAAGRPVTLADIAHHLGISRIAVSYALRGDRRNVSQGTIDRVQAAALELGYDPALAHAARRLRYQHTGERVLNHLVALFFPYAHIHLAYWARILEALQMQLSERGYGLLCCGVDCHRPLTEQLPPLFRRGDVDGAIIFPVDNQRPMLREGLRALPGFAQRPIVSVLEPLPGCASVIFDDVAVGRLAAQHLLDLGHRRLLAFNPGEYCPPMTGLRLEGNRQEVIARGLSPTQVLRVGPWLWQRDEPVEQGLHELLERWPDTTAILCPNDWVGVPMARALRRLGRSFPDDLSIIGVDDTVEWFDGHEHNRWTTIALPLEELGATAAEVLVGILAEERAADTACVLQPHLVERGTTAPPRP